MKDFTFYFGYPYKNREKGLIGLMAATYIAGIVGLLLPLSRPYFLALTPLNLLLSAAILFVFHRDRKPAFLIFCFLSFLTGFFAEVAGVASGLIFGEYSYGKTLGIKWMEVPLIIGINWLMLIYSTGIICARLKTHIILKAAAGASLMVLLDIFIEPVAIAFDFWSWGTPEIPIRNYVAWYIISFFLHLLFFSLPFRKENPAAKFLYLFQLVFFMILCLFTIY